MRVTLDRGWLTAGVIAASLAIATIIAVPLRLHAQRVDVAEAHTLGNASRATAHLRRYGCAGCHTIAGISGADGLVGPELSNMRRRVYLAGSLPNNADNLIRWIVAPRSVDPKTAMPETGVTEQKARDIAAYLYAH